MGTGRWVVVTTYSRGIEARIAAAKLASSGIEWDLLDGAITLRDATVSRVFRRVKLRVRKADYASARETLGLEISLIASDRQGRALKKGQCPECGHRASFAGRLHGWLRRQRFDRCEECGSAWGTA